MRVFKFSPGHAVLPLEVLEQTRDELLDWQGSGSSVMEVSHRGAAFLKVAEQAEADLRELLSIPEGYQGLFMQGGASAQFSTCVSGSRAIPPVRIHTRRPDIPGSPGW
ncbi:aminotransferase class V-fold PLP-dependent enzyme [Lacticaseibacillus rhamnosus]